MVETATNLAVVVYRVSIGQYSAACYDESTGRAAELPLSLPGKRVIRL